MLRVCVNWQVDRLYRAVHSICVGRLLSGSGRLVVEAAAGDPNYSQVARLALAIIADGDFSIGFSEQRMTIEFGPVTLKERTFFRIYRIEGGPDTPLTIATDLLSSILDEDSFAKADSFVFEDLWDANQ